MTQHTNRLIHETSPYLLQHAHNPVDWFPWGEEAFAQARRENKPIFLSVGYSACHWCHVMERESFENAEIAALMNELFINIKVDREERPDVDHIYMNAVQMFTGRGGWPMSVFLTPDGKPFYGGTYYPPEERHNMPAFPRVLTSIAQAYRERPDDVDKQVQQIMDGLQRFEGHSASMQAIDSSLVEDAANRLANAYDETNGGLGQAPKFPNESVFELFLRQFSNTGQRRFLDMSLHTLRRMAQGGVYDQLGGGFHRYSVDERWLVPHFEKMLYDNAQLVPLYLAAYQLTGESLFERVARDTLDYVVREMRDPIGAFYSTQDADSEGVEGKFFVWDVAEVTRVVAEADAEMIRRYWDVTEAGNFEGHNILHVNVELEQLAKLYDRDVAAAEQAIAAARAKLFAARETRIKPGRDEKALTSWNGLTISAFAKGAEVLRSEGYRDVALSGLRFIDTLMQKENRLLSSYKDGAAKLNGYLDDYAFTIAAFLDVFELTQDEYLLDRAAALADATLRHFWDGGEGGFYFTSDDHEVLIVRSKPLFDGSIPSGNSVMARNLLRLDTHLGNDLYRQRAEAVLGLYAGAMRQQAFGLANLICVADLYLNVADQIVVVGEPDDAATRQMVVVVRNTFLPNRSLRVVRPAATERLPGTLRGKHQIDGKATAYVCRGTSCSAPVTSAADLESLLTPQ